MDDTGGRTIQWEGGQVHPYSTNLFVLSCLVV